MCRLPPPFSRQETSQRVLGPTHSVLPNSVTFSVLYVQYDTVYRLTSAPVKRSRLARRIRTYPFHHSRVDKGEVDLVVEKSGPFNPCCWCRVVLWSSASLPGLLAFSSPCPAAKACRLACQGSDGHLAIAPSGQASTRILDH